MASAKDEWEDSVICNECAGTRYIAELESLLESAKDALIYSNDKRTELEAENQLLKSDDLRQPPLSYPVAELPSETGVSRSRLYEEIRRGNLTTFKLGGRRYARHEAVLEWMTNLEDQARLPCNVVNQP